VGELFILFIFFALFSYKLCADPLNKMCKVCTPYHNLCKSLTISPIFQLQFHISEC
jgi:hypothetical protein